MPLPPLQKGWADANFNEDTAAIHEARAPPLAWPDHAEPARPSTHPKGAYSPSLEADRVQKPSSRILEALAYYERQRGLDPCWSRPFWE